MDFLQPLAAVVLVLGLLGAALWLLRRRTGGAFTFSRGTSKRMAVLERTPLTATHALHLVRVGEKSFVIATSPSSCSLLSEVNL